MDNDNRIQRPILIREPGCLKGVPHSRCDVIAHREAQSKQSIPHQRSGLRVEVEKQDQSLVGCKPKISRKLSSRSSLLLLIASILFLETIQVECFVGFASAQTIDNRAHEALRKHQQFPSGADSETPKDIEPCQLCRIVVSSFEKGIERTSRGKHEGGDTSWEERNLKSYADSEIRLVEIQERLCEDSEDPHKKALCLSLAEDSESDIDDWWFKQRNKNVRLHDFLCINKLKRCCPEDKFGSNCQKCPSNCNEHGFCDGSGTRTGTGECNCEPGYEGKECNLCTSDYFRIETTNHFTCRECDPACKTCFGPGQANCTECRTGYYKHETEGCIDINECDAGIDAIGNAAKLCPANKYCVNTDGSYRCADCHVSCSSCVGYGPSMCITCAKGYRLDDEYSCRDEDELEDDLWGEDSILEGKGSLARYFLYLGIVVSSLLLFGTRPTVMNSNTILR